MAFYPLAVGRLAVPGSPIARIALTKRRRARSRWPGCCSARLRAADPGDFVDRPFRGEPRGGLDSPERRRAPDPRRSLIRASFDPFRLDIYRLPGPCRN